MNRIVTLLVMISLCFVAAGCGDSHEKVAADSIPVLRDMAATIETIKDEASAKAAKPKLEAIAKKMKSLKERRNKLPAPTEADIKAMLEKYGDEMEAIQRRMLAGMMTIQFDPKIQAVLGDIDLTTD